MPKFNVTVFLASSEFEVEAKNKDEAYKKAWDEIDSRIPSEEVYLEIEESEPEQVCKDCGSVFEDEPELAECPECGSKRVEVR